MVIYTFKLNSNKKVNMSIQVKQRMFDNISPITGKKLPILSQGTNPKTIKSDNLGEYLTGIDYLSPYKLSGKNLCSHATDGCINSCLNTAGRGKMSNVQKGRLRKSLLFLNNQQEYFKQLCADIRKHIIKCEKTGRKPAIRLNGTSDLPYENILYGENQSIFDIFPQVQFYDYTKNSRRLPSKQGYSQAIGLYRKFPSNYDLTFSYSENTTLENIQAILKKNINVAVVFRKTIPKTFRGFEVINGDNHDLRFLDKKGVILGLTAKGKAKKDTTGFVIDL